MGMRYVVAAFLLIAGALMAWKPDLAWKYAESWKHNGGGTCVPWYRTLIRIGGAVLMIGAICAFIWE